MATKEEMLASLEAPLATETFTLAGVDYTIQEIVGFDTFLDFDREAASLPKVAGKVMVLGREVHQTPALASLAVLMMHGVADPPLTYKEAVALLGRYGMEAGQMVARIKELSPCFQMDPAQQIEQATESLRQDPPAN